MSHKVKIQYIDTKERVAFDLMLKIAESESLMQPNSTPTKKDCQKKILACSIYRVLVCCSC